MIDWSDEHSLFIGGDLLDSQRDRDAHLAVRVRILSKGGRMTLQVRPQLFTPMTGDYDDVFDPGGAYIVNTGFDYGTVTKREQRLERTHAPRASRGQGNCGNGFYIFNPPGRGGRGGRA